MFTILQKWFKHKLSIIPKIQLQARFSSNAVKNYKYSRKAKFLAIAIAGSFILGSVYWSLDQTTKRRYRVYRSGIARAIRYDTSFATKRKTYNVVDISIVQCTVSVPSILMKVTLHCKLIYRSSKIGLRISLDYKWSLYNIDKVRPIMPRLQWHLIIKVYHNTQFIWVHRNNWVFML